MRVTLRLSDGLHHARWRVRAAARAGRRLPRARRGRVRRSASSRLTSRSTSRRARTLADGLTGAPGRSTGPSTTRSTRAARCAGSPVCPGWTACTRPARCSAWTPASTTWSTSPRPSPDFAALRDRGRRRTRRARAVAGARRRHAGAPRCGGPRRARRGPSRTSTPGSSGPGGCCSTSATRRPRGADAADAGATEPRDDPDRPAGLACARPALVPSRERHLARRAARLRRRARRPAPGLRTGPLRRAGRAVRRRSSRPGRTPVSSREVVQRLTAAGLRRRKAMSMAPRAVGNALLRPPRLRARGHGRGRAPARASCRRTGSRPASSGCVVGARGAAVPARARRLADLGYLAGSDEDRAADFTAAWLDPTVVGGLGRARRLRRAADGRPAGLASAGGGAAPAAGRLLRHHRAAPGDGVPAGAGDDPRARRDVARVRDRGECARSSGGR